MAAERATFVSPIMTWPLQLLLFPFSSSPRCFFSSPSARLSFLTLEEPTCRLVVRKNHLSGFTRKWNSENDDLGAGWLVASIFVAMHERFGDFWAIFGRKLREIRSKDTKDATKVRLRELYPN